MIDRMNVNYPLSAFLNSTFDTYVLADQIAAVPAIGQRLNFATLTGTTVSLDFPAAVTGAPKTALDAVVAAHQGRAYGAAIQAAAQMGQQSNPTTSNVTAVNLPLDPLAAGLYLFTWICELATTANTANTGVRAALQSDLSGSFADHFEQNVAAPPAGAPQWTIFTGSVIANINAVGSTPTARIVWRAIGSNTALIRRARLAIQPAN
jgi:hypothetical protein